MDGRSKKDQAAQSGGDFERTVVIARPALRRRRTPAPLRRIIAPFGRRKRELEDLIGTPDVSRYAGAEPDTTAQLTAPLSGLDIQYSVLEKFAAGGHAAVAAARDPALSGSGHPRPDPERKQGFRHLQRGEKREENGLFFRPPEDPRHVLRGRRGSRKTPGAHRRTRPRRQPAVMPPPGRRADVSRTGMFRQNVPARLIFCVSGLYFPHGCPGSSVDRAEVS